MTTKSSITLRAIADIERSCGIHPDMPVHDESECRLLKKVLWGHEVLRCSVCYRRRDKPAKRCTCVGARVDHYMRMPGPEVRIVRKKAQRKKAQS